MRRPALLLARVSVVAAAALALLYVGDDLAVRYRMAHRRPNEPLEDVIVYNAAVLKSGRIEIFYDRPTIEVCVHALFPHLGYEPCWYVNRRAVRVIGDGRPRTLERRARASGAPPVPSVWIVDVLAPGAESPAARRFLAR